MRTLIAAILSRRGTTLSETILPGIFCAIPWWPGPVEVIDAAHLSQEWLLRGVERFA